jgi:cobalt-zinc-cadmium efflux system outer membrane protein
MTFRMTLGRGALALAAVLVPALAQGQPVSPSTTRERAGLGTEVAAYVDEQGGPSAIAIVRRALRSNLSIAAARLDVGRAEARLRQALLYPNPSLDLERTTGKFTGSPDEQATSIGFAMPIELGGKRSSRIDVARAELEGARAAFAERQRQLTNEVLSSYIEALAALRELDTTATLNELDVETGNYLQTRVNEGDVAPLELSLLQVEVERLRSRRALLKGQLEAALIRLKTLASVPSGETLKLRRVFDLSEGQSPAASIDEAVSRALERRPDILSARANERAAEANAKAARAQSVPDVTPFARYGSETSAFDETPVGPLKDRSKSISFGVSMTLPVFNRYQGLRAEANAAVAQARAQREVLETTVRSEVTAAYRRLLGADEALSIYERGVLDRSAENLRTLRAAYQLGEYRITDLIAEQRRVVDAQREYTELLAERYRAAVDLMLATGNITAIEKGANQ